MKSPEHATAPIVERPADELRVCLALLVANLERMNDRAARDQLIEAKMRLRAAIMTLEMEAGDD